MWQRNHQGGATKHLQGVQRGQETQQHGQKVPRPNAGDRFRGDYPRGWTQHR